VRKENRKHNKGGKVMTDYNSQQIFKKKALDRWENEGGRIFADQTGIIYSGTPDERAGKNNAARISEGLKADSSKGKDGGR
jgi:hypothetical protein